MEHDLRAMGPRDDLSQLRSCSSKAVKNNDAKFCKTTVEGRSRSTDRKRAKQN